MAYDPGPLFDELASKLAASGYVESQIAEPMGPPAKGLGAVIFDGVEITELSLGTGSGVVKFILRFYYDALQEPQEDMEKEIARATLFVMDSIAGDFDLGDASVRNVEEMGQAGRPGFQTVGGTMYRLCDLYISVKVNDLVTLTE
jgi:hypothetical protein